NMQSAADQAALAAASAYRNAGQTSALGNNTTAQNAAYATATRNGYSTITVAPFTGGTTCTGTGANAGCIQVTITQNQPRSFTDATVVNNNSRVEGCDSTNITTTCSSKMFLAQTNNPNGTCTPTASTQCPIDIPVVTNSAPAPDPYANLVPPTPSTPCSRNFP